MGNLLVPFKKFLSNKNTITILGVLIGVIVLYAGYNWRVQRSIQPVKIPYAKTTMLSGTKITEDDIEYTSVPKEMISGMSNLLTDVNTIRNKLVSYDAKIPANGFFFKEVLISEEEMPDSVFSNIPDGYTIYRLSVDYDSTYANSILPGQFIDLYMTTEAEEDSGKLVFGRLLSQIEVLAVKDDEGKNVFADKDNPSEPKYLLFAVPEQLFLLLSKAEKLGIEIEPVMRNKSYSSESQGTELESDELEAMIINQTHILTGECTDLTVCG